MKCIVVFEERGGTDDMPSPAKLATDRATKWITLHNAEILHMATAISINHEHGLEDYTLTLHVSIPEAQA